MVPGLLLWESWLDANSQLYAGVWTSSSSSVPNPLPNLTWDSSVTVGNAHAHAQQAILRVGADRGGHVLGTAMVSQRLEPTSEAVSECRGAGEVCVLQQVLNLFAAICLLEGFLGGMVVGT